MTGEDSRTPGDRRAAFKPIVDSRAFEEVVDQLSDAVHTGVYEVGARLPTIDELSRAMSVSKPTVGEAVRVLTRAGVLTVKRGASGGIVVAASLIPPSIIKLSSRRLARDMRELVEARRPVEMALAQLAAERATDFDLADMRAGCDLVESAGGDFDQWLFGNYKFHYAIGRAARSDFLFHMLAEIYKELAILIEGWTPRDSTDPQATIAEHADILAAIERHDPVLARATMDAHLHELEELVPFERLDPTDGRTREAEPFPQHSAPLAGRPTGSASP
jgi:GntR family transcriptional repressor for pyruvate dehydrogenase complex